eukprot:Skav230553  [mRNA]  locus=scaffold2019:94424:99316:- [translate_table: standard]
MNQHGKRMTVDVAVDWDPNCCECYCKTHDVHNVYGPMNYEHEDADTVYPCFLLGDVFSPRWVHLLKNQRIDMMVISPPCPPWSYINSGVGSKRQDGMYMYAAWMLVGVIRPLVVVMEMVANILQHPEWPQVKKFIETRGYSIRWTKALDLCDILPQKRDRLILIATDNESTFALNPHRCVGWPVEDPPTLRSHNIIMDMMLPWCLNVIPTQAVLNMYWNPMFLPNINIGLTRSPKRIKHEVLEYRLRDRDQCFCCILTTYGSAHDMDISVLQSGGLYGAFLADTQAVRFLQVPEILCLFGPTNPQWLPSDPQRATRILGNCISIPHACIGIANALAFLEDMTMVETGDLFSAIVSRRMHAGNIAQTEDREGYLFSFRDGDAIPPTVPMHEFTNVTVTNGMESACIRCELGITFMDILQILLGRDDEVQMAMQPCRQPFLRIPLKPTFVIQDFHTRIVIGVPLRINFASKSFVHHHRSREVTLVCTNLGITAMQRFADMTIQIVDELITTLEMRNEPMRYSDAVGFFHSHDGEVPPVMIGMTKGLTGGPIDTVSGVEMTVSSEGIKWEFDQGDSQAIIQMMNSSGMEQWVQTFGWNFVVPINLSSASPKAQLWLLPKHGHFRLSLGDMCNMLTLQFFLFQLDRVCLSADRSNVMCRFKMFGMWIWKGDIALDRDLQEVVQMWERSRTLFHGPWGLRFVYKARAMMPDIAIRNYCDVDDRAVPVMDIYLQNGQHGGGFVELKPAARRIVRQNDPPPPPPPNAIPSPPSPVSADTHDLPGMEADDFERAQVVMFEQWFRMPRLLNDMPMDDFLGFVFTLEDGMIVFKGDAKRLITLAKHLKHAGIELLMFQCGWLLTIQFIEYGDPPECRLLVLPRADCKGFTRARIHSLLQMCMVAIDMKQSFGDHDAECRVKIKLWGTIVYQGTMSRNTLTDDILQAYMRSSTMLGLPTPMRMVSRGKQMMNEYPIRHYIHPSLETPNMFHMVLQLRGGGGQKPAPLWDAKHALATTMVAAGASLPDTEQFTDHMISKAGPTSIVEACKPASIVAKVNNLRRLANQVQVEMPDIAKQGAKIQQRIKDKLKHEATRVDMQELPKHLQVREGFFKNADGTACPQLPLVQPSTTGFVVLSWTEAAPWLEPPQQLSADEFGILVVGQCGCSQNTTCKKVSVPAFSGPNNPVVFQAVLHQLGGKEISIDDSNDNQVPVSQTSVLCITAFRDEMGEPNWKELISSPIKFCIGHLNVGDNQLLLSSPPWGRSYQKDKKKVTPEEATSFQFHCRIQSSDVKRSLRASGFGGLYTTVKSENRQVSQDYQVVWLQVSTVEIQKLMANHSDHRGMVRSSKIAATSRGLRFTKEEFSAAWAKLRPSEQEPETISARHLFKVSPTPVGATNAELLQFFKTAKLKAKPIKALSSTTWLCAAEERHSDTFLTWNGVTLLVKWVNQRNQQSHVILAGSIPKPVRAKDNRTTPELNASGGGDPWAAYIAQNGTPFTKTPNNGPMQSVPQRKVDAPIESRFQAQDDALEAHKQSTAEAMAKMQNDIKTLQAVAQNTSNRVEANQKSTEAEFHALKSQTAQSFKEMQKSFQASLAQSLKSHETHVSGQFDEIKHLLMQDKADQGTPRKSAKTEHQKDDNL